MRAIITGASGFVGRAILERLSSERQFELRGVVRRRIDNPIEGVAYFPVAELGQVVEWTDVLVGANVVIHTAGRVHMMADTATDSLAEYRRINVAGTLDLAHQAANAGVKRFVFVSSIKVNGERTEPGRPYSVHDDPAPVDPYAVSKYEAEQGLRELAQTTGMEVVVVRPTLVYGPDVQGNFLTMLRWVYRGIPLPLAGLKNKRSLLALENLVDLLRCCSIHPDAANQIFLVADGEDLSVTELLMRLGVALGKPAKLFSVSAGILEAMAALLGKRDHVKRLLGSLQVDDSKTRDILSWTPVVDVGEALRNTAQHFLNTL